jgi:hypothetical protein
VIVNKLPSLSLSLSLSRALSPSLSLALSLALSDGQMESGGSVLAVNVEARAPRGGVTRQGVVLTDLQSLRDCQ